MDLEDLLSGIGSAIGSGGSAGTLSRKSSSMLWWSWIIKSWERAEEASLDKIWSSSKIGTEEA